MRTAILFAASVAACTNLAESSRGPVMGAVDYEGQAWPIHATADGLVWRVYYEGEPVRCTKATVESCYWSLRYHVDAQVDLMAP